MSVTVSIDEDTLVDLLVDRVEYWTDDRDIIELYRDYYSNAVWGGCYEGSDLDIMSIVDNDYVNNLSIITEEEYNNDRNSFLKENIKAYIKENESLYEEEEKEDYIENLKGYISDLKEEAPLFDDLECGENNIEFLSGYYIEAISHISGLLLMS